MDKRIVAVVNLRLQRAAFTGQVNKFGVNLRYAIIQNGHLATFLTRILVRNLAVRGVIIAVYLGALCMLEIFAGDTHIVLERLSV